jgi:hypothetical protein
VRIGILDDEAAYPVRRARRQVQADRRAKVVDVEVEGRDVEAREQVVHQVREARESRVLHGRGVPEPREVRRNHEAVPREWTDHVAKV